MSKHYKYPLKVWLTSALLGTVLGTIVNYIDSMFSFIGTIAYQVKSTWELTSTFLIVWLIATIATIPAWLIFWFVYTKMLKVNRAELYIKSVLIGTSVVLCFLIFVILSIMVNDMNLLMDADIILPYMFAVALCAWVYLPKQVLIKVTNNN
ncbi:MAG: hypothetical protein EOO90_05265 [Pedobacter sp.]|nr:MAG: hypothetical protein EOO90_05265 [Pedobacter sp.]